MFWGRTTAISFFIQTFCSVEVKPCDSSRNGVTEMETTFLTRYQKTAQNKKEWDNNAKNGSYAGHRDGLGYSLYLITMVPSVSGILSFWCQLWWWCPCKHKKLCYYKPLHFVTLKVLLITVRSIIWLSSSFPSRNWNSRHTKLYLLSIYNYTKDPPLTKNKIK